MVPWQRFNYTSIDRCRQPWNEETHNSRSFIEKSMVFIILTRFDSLFTRYKLIEPRVHGIRHSSEVNSFASNRTQEARSTCLSWYTLTLPALRLEAIFHSNLWSIVRYDYRQCSVININVAAFYEGKTSPEHSQEFLYIMGGRYAITCVFVSAEWESLCGRWKREGDKERWRESQSVWGIGETWRSLDYSELDSQWV